LRNVSPALDATKRLVTLPGTELKDNQSSDPGHRAVLTATKEKHEMKHTRVLVPLAAAGVLFASMAAQAEPGRGRPTIKGYSPAGEVSGNLTAIGSDTLNNLMTLWSEAFKKQHPKVKIQIEGKGSTTRAARADRRDRPTGADEPAHEARGCRRLRETVRL
jgi:hypothetical protein